MDDLSCFDSCFFTVRRAGLLDASSMTADKGPSLESACYSCLATSQPNPLLSASMVVARTLWNTMSLPMQPRAVRGPSRNPTFFLRPVLVAQVHVKTELHIICRMHMHIPGLVHVYIYEDRDDRIQESL
jgi:hypothetical protein